MSWVRVCSASEVPSGGMRAFRIDELTIPILVADRGDGDYLASSGICPHEDVELEDGTLEAGRVTCPGHGYEFDMETGRCRHDPALRLRRFPVRVVAGEIHIRVDLYRVSG